MGRPNVSRDKFEDVDSLRVLRELILPQNVAAADGAITAKSGTVYVTKATAAALTIADPQATVDDGKRLSIIATTAAAHTVTYSTTGFNAGGAASDVATFGGSKGDNFEIEAYGGVWYVRSLRNVTLG